MTPDQLLQMKALIADLDEMHDKIVALVEERDDLARRLADEERRARGLQDALLAAENAIGKLERKLQHWIERADRTTVDAKKVSGEITTLSNTILSLTSALAPFAEIDGEGDMDFPDSTVVRATFGRSSDSSLNLGHFRTARRVWSAADKTIDEEALHDA